MKVGSVHGICLCLVLISFTKGLSLSVETRRSTLLSWKSGGAGSFESCDDQEQRVIGYAEERRDMSARTLQVTIGWTLDGENDETIIHLPYIKTPDSLASTIWPSSLATAILSRSPAFQEFMQSKSLLELGCGLGLAGLAASTKCKNARLTDNDETILKVLRDIINEHCYASGPSLKVSNLDWRDVQDVREKYPCILATDVAFYYYLLRPLMDTIRAHLQKTDSFTLTVGQANRESQWNLHNNLLHGCYNQLTDEREDAWPGRTKTLLYQLQMNDWKALGVSDDDAKCDDGPIPIAALLYQTEGLCLPSFCKYDHVASEADIEQMSMTF